MACPGKPKAQRRFDRALASEPAATLPEAGGGQRQYRCFKKTNSALLSAATAAFRTPAGFKGKVNLVHIQSAALAGGVAIGSAATLALQTKCHQRQQWLLMLLVASSALQAPGVKASHCT